MKNGKWNWEIKFIIIYEFKKSALELNDFRGFN